MKKIVTLLLVLCSCTIYAQNITEATRLNRYAEANKPLTKSVVFIGNSITEGWVKASPEFFTSNNYIGRGISGQTSLQLLLRFRQDVINLHPTAVVINIGINDIAENSGPYMPQLTMDCIQSMVELAQHNGIKVILSSVLPAAQFPWRKEVQDVPAKVDELNARIKRYATANNIPHIEYNASMRDENGGMKSGYANDGVHPTKEAYLIMEEIAKKVIDQVLEF